MVTNVIVAKAGHAVNRYDGHANESAYRGTILFSLTKTKARCCRHRALRTTLLAGSVVLKTVLSSVNTADLPRAFLQFSVGIELAYSFAPKLSQMNSVTGHVPRSDNA
jgi:hypothetical protein